MNKKENTLRKKIKRWMREIKVSKQEIGEGENPRSNDEITEIGDPYYRERNRIRERENWIAEASPMPQTDQEKRGDKRKERDTSKSEAKLLRQLKRSYPGLVDGKEETDENFPLFQSMKYSEDRLVLKQAIREAPSAKAALKLKEELKSLPNKYLKLWREWIADLLNYDLGSGQLPGKPRRRARADVEAFLKRYTYPRWKRKPWRDENPECDWDKNRGKDPTFLGEEALRLCAVLLTEMENERVDSKLISALKRSKT